MADVRLTATNPEDSSVVPVACNEKGELKLEEPLVVEGPPGEKGDKGDDGDPFSGNFTGDVYFDGNVGIGAPEPAANFHVNDPTANSQVNAAATSILISSKSETYRKDNYSQILGWSRPSSNGGTLSSFIALRQTDDVGVLAALAFGSDTYSSPVKERMCIAPSGNIGIGTTEPKTRLDIEGKAGFTEEGYLWCTTRRGDTVILDFTSNGMGMWEPYEPPARELADEIRDKLENGSTTDIDSSRLKRD